MKEQIVSEGFMPGLAMKWAARAPALIVMGLKRSWPTHRLAPLLSNIDYCAIDLGIAGEHMVLQAAELGVGTCWIGWIRPSAIRKIIGWPRDIQPVTVLPVGWPAEPAGKAVSRLPIEEISRWYEASAE